MIIEDELFKAAELLAREGGAPEMIWHPDFGWMNLKTGKPVEVIRSFYKWLEDRASNPEPAG
jgi:SH3-like domain-containing protein